MNLNKKVANKLKNIRKKRGLTQNDVANALFCTRQNISLLETGKKNIEMSDIEALGNFYQKPPMYFLSDFSN